MYRNYLIHFDPDRYSKHLQIDFLNEIEAKNHFLSHIKDGKYHFKDREPLNIYELEKELINDQSRLKFYVKVIESLMTEGAYKSEIPVNRNSDYNFILECRKEINLWERLLNKLEYCQGYSTRNINPNTLYNYSVENMIYWWKNNQENIRDIELTVALPILNNFQIVWLPLESLHRQTNVDFGWELISFEEDGLSRELFKEYSLKLPFCQRIVHRNIRPGDGLFPPGYTLFEKWVNISNIASPTSKIFMAQASDDYSPRCRMKLQYECFKDNNCLFCKRRKGLFYHLIKGLYAKYDISNHPDKNFQLKQGLDYAVRMSVYKSTKLLDFPTFRNIDRLFSTNIDLSDKCVVYYDDTNPESYLDGLCTDGFNNISLKRTNYYTNNICEWLFPVEKTSDEVKKLTIPDSIVKRLEITNE